MRWKQTRRQEQWEQKARQKNVTVDDESVRLVVICNQCGAKWSPNLRTGGRLPRGWWKCPNGCNAQAAAAD